MFVRCAVAGRVSCPIGSGQDHPGTGIRYATTSRQASTVVPGATEYTVPHMQPPGSTKRHGQADPQHLISAS